MPSPNEPVNLAAPNWGCPHCGYGYGPDLDAAKRCGEAGPADDIANDVVVLKLADKEPVFGVAEAGPVRAERVDGAVVRHRRDVTVCGTELNSKVLLGAAPGELVILGPGERRYGSYGDVRAYVQQALVVFGDERGGYRSSSWNTPGSDGLRPIRLVDRHYRSASDWFGPLTDELRELLDMLTKGTVSAVAEADPDDLVDRLLNTDPRRLRQSYVTTGIASVLGFELLEAVCEAHGAVEDIVATRWLTDHAETVTQWTMGRLVEWAGGGDVSAPAATFRAAELPRSPGKKRLAQMAAVNADDYRTAMTNVLAALNVDAPTNPIPSLGDAVELYQARSAEARKERS